MVYIHPPPLDKKGSISSRLWIFLVFTQVLISVYWFLPVLNVVFLFGLRLSFLIKDFLIKGGGV